MVERRLLVVAQSVAGRVVTKTTQRVKKVSALLHYQIADLFERRPCRGRREVPRHLSHFRIRRRIGKGSNGNVYLADDETLNRDVALKLLRDRLIENRERRERFINEARLNSAVNHPNIVAVYAFDHDQGFDFTVMEYVAGKTLAQWTPAQGVRLSAAMDYASQITSAVAAAHAHGIAHRDLKPANFMVSADHRIKLLDFGLAKRVSKTKTEKCCGMVYGTVGYMSPEQCRGEAAQLSSDVFSLGAILYELFSGRRAFAGHSPIETIKLVLTADAAALSKRVPVRIAKIIMRCLEKTPTRRYPTAVELSQELKYVARLL